MFRANIENCEAPKYEKIIDGYFEFLFVDKNGNPVVAMNWHHRLNHMGEFNTKNGEERVMIKVLFVYHGRMRIFSLKMQ